MRKLGTMNFVLHPSLLLSKGLPRWCQTEALSSTASCTSQFTRFFPATLSPVGTPEPSSQCTIWKRSCTHSI
ncbi:hypothetical protein BDV98DRAFT_108590 [Pterulicium gracile]|uniref:Uncharacterized protein n=1 Tax=Pterulicium gracile TaxID=1884261 RepID=A0A5C3QF40_9AGAR|nr:hypothetical protein BDV98DRAFT_108590 [Pterula gracilis]